MFEFPFMEHFNYKMSGEEFFKFKAKSRIVNQIPFVDELTGSPNDEMAYFNEQKFDMKIEKKASYFHSKISNFYYTFF